MQIQVYLDRLMRRKMAEAGEDPDAEAGPVKTLATPADLADFFG